VEIYELITLSDYNCWATEKVIKSAEALSSKQLTAQIQCSHGSIRGTFVPYTECRVDLASEMSGRYITGPFY
jgi:uncharacterized damage-inducible protein DinB